MRTPVKVPTAVRPLGATPVRPPLAGRLVGVVEMTWSMLTYYSLTPLLTVLILGMSSAAVLTARLVARS